MSPKHRKPAEDSNDVTDILAVEVPDPDADDGFVPLAPPRKTPPRKRPKPPPPLNRESGPLSLKHNDYAPMFTGFNRSSPQPKQPAAAKPAAPKETPAAALMRRRITILGLSAGLALTSFALMLWMFASQPSCPKPPKLRPPITITVTPGPPTYIPHHY